MLDMAVASLMARDLSERQFGETPRHHRGAPPGEPVVRARRAPVRRSTAWVLRKLADRLEPAPRCAQLG